MKQKVMNIIKNKKFLIGVAVAISGFVYATYFKGYGISSKGICEKDDSLKIDTVIIKDTVKIQMDTVLLVVDSIK